jgi:CPA2 family monovalent cation:H+ antiporter-2
VEVSHDFLLTFALVLCAAAVTTVVFERLRQPVILGYLLAGLLIGPHVTFIPLVADRETTETLAELGVILLLFAIGLEFSIRRLLRVGGSVAVTAVIDISLMAWLGIAAATLMGWTQREILFTGAITAISSTTIIAKTFDDKKVGRKLRDLVFGVLIVEDLAAVLFLAGLATLGPGAGEGTPFLMTLGRLVALLAVWVIGGLLVIPRVMRFVIGLGRSETTLIASLGLCFGFALLAQWLGYSVALGAFIAGSLISESGKGEAVAHLVRPVRDLFAAVFFVAVGMLIDPAMILAHWHAVVILTLVVMLGKMISVSTGSFLAGQGTRTAVRAGMSMAQIGEFSFIIASLGLAIGAVGDFLYPVAVAVSAITTLTTPYLVGASEQVAALVDRKLPKPLQTYATLYATWVEELGKASAQRSGGDRVRRLARWLLIDTAALTAVVIGMAVGGPYVERFMVTRVGLGDGLAEAGMWITAGVLATPFLFGIFRVSRGLAELLARSALPKHGRMDHAAAPRRALVITLEVAIVFLLGLPFLALTQPFLPPFQVAAVLAVILIGLAVSGWRSATNLEGHVSAGAEVLLSAIRHSLPPEHATTEFPVQDRLVTATHMLPGMGSPERFKVEPDSFAVGRTIGELGVRGRTGATVLAITRDNIGIPAPSKVERLEAGDILLLVGSKEAVQAAKAILVAGTEPEE